VRVDRCDDAVEVGLAAANASGLYVILRIQELLQRRLVVVDGGVERQRTTRVAGIGVHAFTRDGSIGFASVDDVTPEAVRTAVRQAGALAEGARELGAERTQTPFGLQGAGRVLLEPPNVARAGSTVADQMRTLIQAQEALGNVELGQDRTVRTTLLAVDEEWRIVRSDGTDVSFATPRASLRHDLSARIDGRITRAAANVAGDDIAAIMSEDALRRLTRRASRAAADARMSASAPAPRSGSYRVVLRHALAKGLAHEAIGHLCESDVDGSVLMRRGRLRLGERLAQETVSIVDGLLPGDYVQQPISANGLSRQTVALVDRGVLSAGLGDLFSAELAGVPVTGACRAGSFRDRPTPRMTNIRIEVADAAPLDVDPDELTPEDVVAALGRLGLLERDQPTIYLTGYGGGQAHPRRGDFVFGADAAFDLSAGGAPRGPASFSGLAECALAAIVAGIGPLCTDAIGTCSKDGSGVSSSGGSHALLVLDPDPDLIVSAGS
jgi:TldD protein